MKNLLVLSMHDLDAWQVLSTEKRLPGGRMPYGMQALESAFELEWTDAAHRGFFASRPIRVFGGAVRRETPGLRGLVGAAAIGWRPRHADAVLSIFENAGMAYARRQGYSRNEPAPHVMMVCWLAEDIRGMKVHELRSIRRSLRSVAAIVVFSANQVDILSSTLDVPESKIHVAPFGVDTRMYDPALVEGPAGGGGVVAIGSDSRRDYATLFEAVRLSGIPLTVACQPRNVAGLDVPPEVSLVVGAYDEEYRRLLHGADLIVTATTAPAYPSGQSVVLEAMSMGKATLTTDSPAMREYVSDGVTGVLMPPRQPTRTAELVGSLMADEATRGRLGAQAYREARERFSLDHMWDTVGSVLKSVVR